MTVSIVSCDLALWTELSDGQGHEDRPSLRTAAVASTSPTIRSDLQAHHGKAMSCSDINKCHHTSGPHISGNESSHLVGLHIKTQQGINAKLQYWLEYVVQYMCTMCVAYSDTCEVSYYM